MGRAGRRSAGKTAAASEQEADRIDDLPNGKIRTSIIYGNGAAMGFTPQEVDRMSVWQYAAAVEGFNRANAADGGNKLTDAEKAELSEWILSAPTAPRRLSNIIYSWDGRDFAPIKTASFEIGG